MLPSARVIPRWLFGDNPYSPAGADVVPNPLPSRGHLASRWLFLRALGLIFFSAFYSLFFQVRGLIGSDGLLPAGEYLQAVKQFAGASRFWYAPTLLWINSGSRSLMVLVWIGMIAAALLVMNIWPRATIAICVAVFLSFIAALQAFSSYQSDGMLLGAGFLSLFFAPPGWRPGWGERHAPSRASLFLLQWLWFTIYFESGVVKITSGDPEWRHLTAMQEYYQNGPLPTWIAWYAQHLPHWFHIGTAALVLLLELVLVWMLFLPRPFRLILFWIVTPWQIGIILTSNYAFLNYLVLVLGVLLLDDQYLWRILPRRLRAAAEPHAGESATTEVPEPAASPNHDGRPSIARVAAEARLMLAAFFLTWVFYATAAQLLLLIFPALPLTTEPVVALEPFRIAERYGLFAVMTRGRYEVEFQGSTDGSSWTAYPFRYKPQDPRKAPGIYAPYQPRFDWNLWFASLDNWQQNRFVVYTEERLLENTPSVLALFAGNPFADAPPRQVRAVIWQYWFTDWAEKRQGFWWRRTFIGLYAPQIARNSDGKLSIVALPQPGLPPRE
jgi:lipase maturation factor 1